VKNLTQTQDRIEYRAGGTGEIIAQVHALGSAGVTPAAQEASAISFKRRRSFRSAFGGQCVNGPIWVRLGISRSPSAQQRPLSRHPFGFQEQFLKRRVGQVRGT
jgi:hypothetical protein